MKSPKVRSPGPSLTKLDHTELTRLMDRLETKLKELH